MNIAYTIGVGKFLPMAKIAAEQMHKHTGWPVVILNDNDYNAVPKRAEPMTVDLKTNVCTFGKETGCYWLKYHGFDFFPDSDRLLYFDADMLCVKDWEVPDVDFCVVLDWMSEQVLNECKVLNIPPHYYFNAGMMIVSRDCKQVFDRTLELGPTGFWVDQGAVNLAAYEYKCATYLERKYNRLINAAHYEEMAHYTDTVNWHFFNSSGCVDDRVKFMQSLCD